MTGVIIYLLGEKAPDGLHTGAHHQVPGQSTGAMEIVVSQPGILELDDAWHYLLARGCEPIHLLVTQMKQGHLRPLYPLVRLTGVERAASNPGGAGGPGRILH